MSFKPSDTTNFKTIIKRVKDRNDSVITEFSFWKFQNGLDTATIVKKRFNNRGKLIEVQSSVNKKNAREIDDDTGEYTYHLKYDYDDRDRLIYYRNLESNEYKRISYP